jgi:hypothetical protein
MTRHPKPPTAPAQSAPAKTFTSVRTRDGGRAVHQVGGPVDVRVVEITPNAHNVIVDTLNAQRLSQTTA